MTEPSQTATDESQAVPNVTDEAEESTNGDARSQRKPYLKIFSPETGISDFELPDTKIIIGRSAHADIVLTHHTVSRCHAIIASVDGKYTLEDADSNYGTSVNNHRVESHVLRHGDSIQISFYVLEFREHPALPGAAAAAARAQSMLRASFSLLPSSMYLSYRPLEVDAKEIFKTGDTLKVGYGGLLIPRPAPLKDCVCLELELRWPNGAMKRYLGEILGVFSEAATDWMCVKLHTVSRDIYDVIISAANPGSWVEVAAT